MNYLLLISTASCAFENFLPAVLTYILTKIFFHQKSDDSLRTELRNLKQEMAGISMVDQFSKYAKLQRKYNKTEEEFKVKVNQRLSAKMKAKMVITSVFRVVNTILTMGLLYLYRGELVVALPQGTLWPLEKYLSWPGTEASGISLVMWIFITRLAFSALELKDSS